MSFAPADRVLASPRHLAGGGLDRIGDTLGPLIHLFGWNYTHDAFSDQPRADGSLPSSVPTQDQAPAIAATPTATPPWARHR
ncbi:hypothetical protein [Streptomyces sp. NPDC002324]